MTLPDGTVIPRQEKRSTSSSARPSSGTATRSSRSSPSGTPPCRHSGSASPERQDPSEQLYYQRLAVGAPAARRRHRARRSPTCPSRPSTLSTSQPSPPCLSRCRATTAPPTAPDQRRGKGADERQHATRIRQRVLQLLRRWNLRFLSLMKVSSCSSRLRRHGAWKPSLRESGRQLRWLILMPATAVLFRRSSRATSTQHLKRRVSAISPAFSRSAGEASITTTHGVSPGASAPGRSCSADLVPFRTRFSRPGMRGLAEADVDVLEALVPLGLGVGGVGTLVCGGEVSVVGERREQAARP
jgi:hypothetical protein